MYETVLSRFCITDRFQRVSAYSDIIMFKHALNLCLVINGQLLTANLGYTFFYSKIFLYKKCYNDFYLICEFLRFGLTQRKHYSR